MNIKLGNRGFYIRGTGKVQEYYDNRMIDLIFDDTLYGDFNRYKKYIENSVVLDLGSHIGCMTKKFINFGAKQVICIEPNPILVECLLNNFKTYSNVKILHAAVDDTAGIKSFYVAKNNSGMSTLEKEKSIKNTYMNKFHKLNTLKENFTEISVDTLSFNELVKTYNPSVLKVDIECTEWKILDKEPPKEIKLVIIEWHNSLYPQYDITQLPEWINKWKVLFDVFKGDWAREMIIANVL
jgi:FkbM family methyltransferase